MQQGTAADDDIALRLCKQEEDASSSESPYLRDEERARFGTAGHRSGEHFNDDNSLGSVSAPNTFFFSASVGRKQVPVVVYPGFRCGWVI